MNQNSAVAQFLQRGSLSKTKPTMEIDATTETIMTDEVMTEQPPAAAAAAMDMEEDDAPPARLMITKMVRFNHS